MQRIGRVDRRLDPTVEARMVKDHPARRPAGKVKYFNFLPPDDLDGLLRLYSKVSGKVLLISKALGIEHGKLLGPGDEYEMLQEFSSSEGEATEIEELHLEYQQLLIDHRALTKDSMPSRAECSAGGPHPRASRCSSATEYALDVELGEFTLEVGITRWYLYDVLIDYRVRTADRRRRAFERLGARELSLDRPVHCCS